MKNKFKHNVNVSIGSIGFWKETDTSNKKLDIEKAVFESLMIVYPKLELSLTLKKIVTLKLIQDEKLSYYSLTYNDDELHSYPDEEAIELYAWINDFQDFVLHNKEKLLTICEEYYRKKISLELIYKDIIDTNALKFWEK